MERVHEMPSIHGSGHRTPASLVAGLRRFRQEVYPAQQARWSELATRQEPSTLFITCADSRIDPNLLMQAVPGELFVCRNPGNLVPPEGVEDGGVATTAEYAVDMLKVRHAIVCGHSDCGAMRGLIEPGKVNQLPSVTAWLRHARAAQRIFEAVHHRGPDELRLLTEENVLAQLASLRTYPAVAAALAAGRLTLHGWYYDIGSGLVFAWDEDERRFVPLVEAPGAEPGLRHEHVL